MTTVFIDESGPFIRCGGQSYFVVASFTVDNPRRTAKAFRTWQAAKFPKKKRFQSENKFSDSGITDNLRLRTIRFISSLDVQIHYGFFHCENISADYLFRGKVREGHVYTQIVGEILESYFPISGSEFFVFCDERTLKGMRQDEFRRQLVARLLVVAQIGSKITVQQVDSATDPNIQIADWIVGALAAFLNGKHMGKEYRDALQHNIIGNTIELFKKLKEQKTQSFD